MSTSNEILSIPEIVGLDARSSLIRIPPKLDVPLTDRARKIIDSRAFRRLSNVSQLGFVHLVYPGATHSRFEHSLGVYRLTLLLLKRLAHDERFAAFVKTDEVNILILAALLHDIGHFPFCHLLEDLKLFGLRSHEDAAEDYIKGELAEMIRNDWNVAPENVCDILMKRAPQRRANESNEEYLRRNKVFHLMASILSGPIDVDKMDYLMRDSIAAGVPYGENYDVDRLVGSICLNREGDGIAILSKGKTAAELMVFARYIMFSEVYWHHAVRSATAMFQRAVFHIADSVGARQIIDNLKNSSDDDVKLRLAPSCAHLASGKGNEQCGAVELLEGIFGPQRRLYKRIRQFSAMEAPQLYHHIAGKSYPEICVLSDRLALLLNVTRDKILIDAPPVEKEVEFKIDVYYANEDLYRPLSSVSPVVRALAQEQFDDYVKRVRIFAAPELIPTIQNVENLDAVLKRALAETVSERQ